MHLQSRELVFDSRAYDAGTGSRLSEPYAASLVTRRWDGSDVTIAFGTDGPGGEDCQLHGFYPREEWGLWSRTAEPQIVLPFALEGAVSLALRVRGLGTNVGRTIAVEIGGQDRPIVLTEGPEEHRLEIELARPANVISFAGLDARRIAGLMDTRTMALGLVSLSIESRQAPAPRRRWAWDAAENLGRRHVPHGLDGIVYIARLDPEDRRANLEDLLTAFCFALGDKEDATLLCRLGARPRPSVVEHFANHLTPVGPMKCRVVAVADATPGRVRKMRRRANYFVSASREAEEIGTLLSHLKAGLPAVAPDHSAFAGHVDAATGFAVRASPEPTSWPGSGDAPLDSLWYRIDWQSLVDGLRESYRVAVSDSPRYRRMRDAARRASRQPAAR